MEKNYGYKDEIISSRVGNVGGSDARILAAIAKNGCVQRAQVERLAIAKGLYERPNITNIAMQYGDFIENMIYDSLVQVDERWESNKCFRSQKYGREGLGLLVHIDFSLPLSLSVSSRLAKATMRIFIWLRLSKILLFDGMRYSDVGNVATLM